MAQPLKPSLVGGHEGFDEKPPIYGRHNMRLEHHNENDEKMHPDIHADRVTPDNPGAFLYAKLLQNYSFFALPVNNSRSTVIIRVLLKLTQIVDVDEKAQIMTTNIWLRHEWFDYSLQWDPKHYGGIKSFYIPADELWLPDTVLYNK